MAAPAGLFALAVAIRALPWPRVLSENWVFPFGSDAYYHLRRIVYSVVHFPAILEFDPYINFPVGAKPIWTPFLDLLIAGLSRPWVRELTEGGLLDIERFAVWVPPVLGGACVVAAYELARRQFGFAPALLTGIVLSLLSAHFWYSQIGFIDHHAAVALVTTLLLAAAMSLLRAAQRDRGGAVWRKAIWTGALAGCALLVWPGSLLHVGLLECGLFVYLLTRPQRAEAVACASWLSALHAAAFLCVAPFSLGNKWPQWGSLNPVVLSNFQPWLLALIGAAILAARRLWTLGPLGATRARRFAVLALVGSALLGFSAALLPELRVGAEDAWSWLAKQERFQVNVAESRPLFFSEGRLELTTATSRLSYFVYCFPIALMVLAAAGRRERDRAALWLLLGWGAGLFALTLLQRRFFNSLSVVFSVVLAVSLCRAQCALTGGGGRAVGRRAAVAVACGAALLLLMLPTLRTYGPHVRNLRALARGDKLALPPNIVVTRAAIEVCAWLRNQTPRTVGWLDPTQRPHYGVLAPWYLGHIIKYVARRPTVVDNFGDDVGRESFAWSQKYYLSTESEALPGLDARQVRYVVVHRQYEKFLGDEPPLEKLFHSLYTYDGARFVSGEPDLLEVPALARHRLVFESRAFPTEGSDDPPIFKVYEVVPGALVVGRAAPGTDIRVTLSLSTNQNRKILYGAVARTDTQGRYELRLPYATQGGPWSTKTDPAYEFRCNGEVHFLALGEERIRQSSVVSGPKMCAETR